MESIYRSGFCYLHQNRFPDRSLCYIDDIVFVVVVTAVFVGTTAALVASDDLFAPDNHGVS
jgi:hypothetical protein